MHLRRAALIVCFFETEVPLPGPLIGPPCPVVTFLPAWSGALLGDVAMLLPDAGEAARSLDAECEELGGVKEPAKSTARAGKTTILFMKHCPRLLQAHCARHGNPSLDLASRPQSLIARTVAGIAAGV